VKASHAALLSGECPRCAVALHSARSAQAWCPACEWNLDAFEPRRRPAELGWRWIDRLTHRVAYRLTARQFARLADRPIERRAYPAARILVLVAAVFLLGLVLAMFTAGIWLILYDFPRFTIVPGVVLVALAIALRPRLGKVPEDVELLDPERVPALAELVELVCAEVGAPVPHLVGVSADHGAYTTSVGWRRERLLCLGLPFWAVLDEQERVALLGHEMAHFVNGDVRRAPLEGMALTTLGEVAHLTAPERGGDGGLLGLLTTVIQGVLSSVVFAAHLLLVWISQRDAQRAEYRADELAARAGGTEAAVRLSDVLLLHDAVDTVVRREARAGRGAEAWRAAARVARANLAGSLPGLRQLSRRDEVSLFASHPPAGLRSAMLEHRPAQAAAVVLTEAWSARIDDELAEHVESVRRELVL
jgi:Zn-dependent protease with chaperone function